MGFSAATWMVVAISSNCLGGSRLRKVLGQYLERFGAIYLRKVDKLFRQIAFDTGT
jgi:hypothetical protein